MLERADVRYYTSSEFGTLLVAARSKAWVCGRSLAGIVGSNPVGVYGCFSPVSVVCCQVEVYSTD